MHNLRSQRIIGKICIMNHNWEMITITPVEIVEDEDGQPVVLIDPDKAAEADSNSMYGCRRCHEPLVDAYGTECLGEDPK